MDANRKWRWQLGGVLVLALAVPATLAQTRVEERVVTRPDGTVIYPIGNEREARGGSWWRDRGVDAEERERRRLETRRDAVERRELRAREREAALENPARQVSPAAGR